PTRRSSDLQGLLLEVRPYPDLADVQGQAAAKRALLIAAAGSHNLLFTGPPGTGKTLLASRLPGLLPPLNEQEALEVAAIQSVASHAPLDAWPQRPFFATPITAHPGRPWWAVAADLDQAKLPWLTRACCSSMNCRSLIARCWRCCVNPWKAERSLSPAPATRYVFQHASSWSLL